MWKHIQSLSGIPTRDPIDQAVRCLYAFYMYEFLYPIGYLTLYGLMDCIKEWMKEWMLTFNSLFIAHPMSDTELY
jgi:hypothetical protein